MRPSMLLGAALGLVTAVYAAPAPPSAASFYVKHMPDLNTQHSADHPLHVYAGHLSSDPKAPTATHSKDVTAHLYFVYTKARRTADRERVIFWFNGGPGCSSFDGLMMETGPWRIDGKGGLKLVENGWEEYTHVVYIDQPPGTGFSYTSTDKYLHELDEAAAHVVQFMKNFYEVFPELEEMDTYLAGESFAGQYIPYIADALLKTSSPKAPLRGVAIGNGWIDGRNQYPAYVDFALEKGLIKKGTKEFDKVDRQMQRCWKALNQTTKDTVNVGDCEGVMSSVTDALVTSVNGKQMCLNVYDIRLSDEFPACGMNWPPDLKDVYTYLRRKDVISSMHATGKAEAWTECVGTVSQSFYTKTSPPSVTLLPGLLERGVKVMLFSGDQDFICNYMGTEKLISDLKWSGNTGMGNATTLGWKVNGTDAGWWQESRNLTYVKVAGASHMVPYDVPVVAHDMILRFMDVDFKLLGGGTGATVVSSVGDSVKQVGAVDGTTPKPTDTTSGPQKGSSEQDKAMWEAYYNAGSAALIFVLILVFVGIFLYWRSRRSKRLGKVNLPTEEDREERIPLSTNLAGTASRDDFRRNSRDELRGEGEPMFDVGDDSGSDDERRK
ncbi:Serine carboxypeptidase [Ceratobasidium sp. AG-Ba]|nr:Serine carboxypeptidase [Ceratobasidium sp. AG-Ba]